MKGRSVGIPVVVAAALAVDPSRRPDRRVGMRGSSWLSMTRKWVFPHPIIQRARVFTFVLSFASPVNRSAVKRTVIEPVHVCRSRSVRVRVCI